jgi:thymidine kinase
MENSIDLIIGPMYSAKTTELIRRLTIYAELGLKVLYINSCLDDRSDSIKEVFSTHNPTLQFADLSIANIHSIKTQKLNNILSNACLYDIIGIDEGQLFIDLKTFTLALVERYNKKVIIAGLNGDFKREPFGELLNMIPYCDNIIKLSPFCQSCAEKMPKILRQAPFTKRICSDLKTVVIIGGKTSYIPVCRECYLK